MDIRIGVIGFCGHSYLALRDWDSLAQAGIRISLTALAQTGTGQIPDAWLALQTEHNARVCKEWRDVINDETIDVVVVDGPYHLHAEMLLAALRAGKHVFCEKSIALNWREIHEIEHMLATSNRCVWAMLNMRYQAGFNTVLQAVSEHRIGAVQGIKVQKSYKHGQRPNWYNDRQLYGGTALWVGNHAIDLLVAAGGPIESVQALHRCANKSYEMLIHVQCQHSSGVLSSASIDFFQPEAASEHSDDRLHISGTDGVIEYSRGAVRLLNQHGEQDLPLAPPEYGIFADGILSIVNGTDTLVSRDEMLMITRASLAVRDSADNRGQQQILETYAGADRG